MRSDTQHAREQHALSVFHLQAVLRRQHPNALGKKPKAQAEVLSQRACWGEYEQGAAAATRRGSQHRGKQASVDPPARVQLRSRHSATRALGPDPAHKPLGGKGPEPPPDPDGGSNPNMALSAHFCISTMPLLCAPLRG